MKNKKNLVKFAILLIALAAIVFLVRYYNLEGYITGAGLQEEIESYGIFAPIAYIIIYAIITIVFLPAAPLTVISGILFGAFYGTLYTVIGATIGAVIAFYIAKYLAKPFFEDMAKQKFKKIVEYDEKLKENGLATVLFLRFLPLFPFNGLNFVLGITRVKSFDYIIGTFIGIIPGTFVYAYFGESLGTLDPVQIAISVGLIVLLGLIFPIYKRIKKKKGVKKKHEKK